MADLHLSNIDKFGIRLISEFTNVGSLLSQCGTLGIQISEIYSNDVIDVNVVETAINSGNKNIIPFPDYHMELSFYLRDLDTVKFINVMKRVHLELDYPHTNIEYITAFTYFSIYYFILVGLVLDYQDYLRKDLDPKVRPLPHQSYRMIYNFLKFIDRSVGDSGSDFMIYSGKMPTRDTIYVASLAVEMGRSLHRRVF